jgi:hypothetical protein
MVTRATVKNSGSKPKIAKRVAGSVPANRHMPKKPSDNPSRWWEVIMQQIRGMPRAAGLLLVNVQNNTHAV